MTSSWKPSADHVRNVLTHLQQDLRSRLAGGAPTGPGSPLTEEWLGRAPENEAPVAPPPEVVAASEDPARRCDQYVLVEQIGAGAMGDVWKAWDVQLRRWAAIKFLKFREPRAIVRFLREARSVASLDHPNVVAVYGTGTSNGIPYIAMQLADGAGVHGAKLDLRRAVEILRDAAYGVHHAHLRGIVHRDLKPANILLDSSGRVRVTDFGLAMTAAQPDRRATGAHAVIGTPLFMSPEQARGETSRIGPAADIFSLGASLYHVVTGRYVFGEGNAAELLTSVAACEVIPPRSVRPDLPADLESILLRALRREPAERYPTAEEFAQDLDRFLAGESVLARRRGPVERARAWIRRNPLPALAAITLMLALPGVFFLMVRMGRVRAQANATEEMVARRHLASERLAPVRKVLDRWQESNIGPEVGERRALRETLDGILRDFPDVGAGWIEAGRLLLWEPDEDRAEEAFGEAVKDPESRVDGLFRRCRLHLARNKKDSVPLDVIRRDPGRAENLRKAAADFDAFMGLPTSPRKEHLLPSLKALMAFHRAETPDALLAAVKLLRAARETLSMPAWESHHFEGRAYFRMRDYAKAVECLDLSFSMGRPNYYSRYLRGTARMELAGARTDGEAEQLLRGAVEDLTLSLAQRPTYEWGFANRGAAFVMLAKVLRARGGDASVELAAGLADSMEAVRINPSEASYRMNAASVRLLQRDWAGALLDLEAACRLDPARTAPADPLIKFCRDQLK